MSGVVFGDIHAPASYSMALILSRIGVIAAGGFMRFPRYLSCLLIVLAHAGVGHAAPMFMGLGDLAGGSFRSGAQAVSADGTVVTGSSRVAIGSEAFRYESGVLTGLGELPGGEIHSQGFGISRDGTTVVGSSNTEFDVEAMSESGGTMVGLGMLPGGDPSLQWTEAYDANEDGSVIVGYGLNSSLDKEAFIYSGGAMVGLGDLPGGDFNSYAGAVSADGSVVTGRGMSASGREAFRWTSSGGMVGLGDLPGGSFDSIGTDISADGSIIVGGSDAEAFIWTAELGMQGLGILPGWVTSGAAGVSDDGSVVVGVLVDNSIPFPDNSAAMIWTSSGGMKELQDYLVNDLGLDLSGWTLRNALDVSADGSVIVGSGLNPSGDTEGWMAIVPEPSTALLLGLGLVGLAARRRRH